MKRFVLLALIALAVVGGAAAALTAGSGNSPSISGPAPNSAAVAKKLADKITRAKSDGARYQALLAVMDALNLGVYTPGGKAILRGAERGPKDFFLYDLELRMTARALARHEEWGISDLTSALAGMGIKPGGEPLPDNDVVAVISDGTRAAAAKTNDPRAVLPLLVRELGLRHRPSYDTARLGSYSVGRVRFDALQKLLILLDSTAPILRRAGLIRGHAALDAYSNGPAAFRAPAAECADVHGTPEKEGAGAKVGEYLGEKLTETILEHASDFFKQANEIAELAEKIVDGIHGSILAYSADVRSLGPSNQLTHYGPPGHAANGGKELKFQLKVEMLDSLPGVDQKCGSIVHTKFPPKGPIAGVTVLWETSDLDQYGDLSCEGLICTTETGPDGIATLTFTPKKEFLPGVGMVVEQPGLAIGTAFVQSRFGNALGTIAEVLAPKSGVTRWTVERHKPRGYKFEGLTLHWVQQQDQGTGTPETETDDVSIKGSICGEDPYGVWKLEGHTTQKVENSELRDNGTFVDPAPSGGDDFRPEEGVPVNGPEGKWKLLPTEPPKVQLEWSAPPPSEVSTGTYFTPSSQTVTAPIVEDKSCPEQP